MLITDVNDGVKNINFLPPLGESDHCTLKFCMKLDFEVVNKNILGPSAVRKFNYNKGKYLDFKQSLGEEEMNLKNFALIVV